MRRVVLFFVFSSLVLSTPAAFKRITHGFKVKKVELSFPNRPEWDTTPFSEVYSLLNQKFTYFSKGCQCYVFLGEDKKTILKLFRYDRILDESKITLLFNASKIAYSKLAKETGVIFVHLNESDIGLKPIEMRGPLGKAFTLDLNRYRFALQKRAEPFEKTLQDAKKDPEKMKALIKSFTDLLASRAEKGILNTDPSLSRNFGFLEGRAVEIDFGNFRDVGSKLDQAKEVARYKTKLRKWLQRQAPDYVEYLDRSK